VYQGFEFGFSFGKQTTNKAYNDYQLQLENKLRNTSKYNGKDFWKILNRFAKNEKDDQYNISIETLNTFSPALWYSTFV
jgi:ribosomal protein L18E